MISIVTGTLNRLELLKKVIENTVDSCDKLELVLVDGGSTDGTLEYVRSLNHPKIKLVEVGARSYYWDFMNLGIKNSTFDYICQWNDDIILENSWEDVIKEIKQDYDFYIFSWLDPYGEYVIYDTGEEFVMNYGIYHKDIFKKIGMYNNVYKYYFCDGDMSYRAKCFGFKYKTLYNIKCRPLTNMHEKKAYLENIDVESQIYRDHLQMYKSLDLPKNIEFLI